MSKIPLVYIAGPFRAPEFAAVQRNIDTAAWLRAPIAKLGCFPICVHVAEGLAMHDLQQENNGQWWLDATMAVLERCDAVVLVPGWRKSEGTVAEVKRALELGLPVFECDELSEIGAPYRWYRAVAFTNGVLEYSGWDSPMTGTDTFEEWAQEQKK